MLPADYLVNIASLVTSCAYAVLWWEWLINLKIEVRCIWRAEWSTMKVCRAFIRNR